MANLIRTQRTYATVANAEKVIAKAFGNLDNVRYLIAVSPLDGRYVPVLVGNQYIPYAVLGNISVVS
jgi:exosome complex RNA-binding protein Rrp4